MDTNPCLEIMMNTGYCSLTYRPTFETPTMTYPTVTKWGIREMTKSQQESYFRRMMTPAEKIADLEERVSYLESLLKSKI